MAINPITGFDDGQPVATSYGNPYAQTNSQNAPIQAPIYNNAATTNSAGNMNNYLTNPAAFGQSPSITNSFTSTPSNYGNINAATNNGLGGFQSAGIDASLQNLNAVPSDAYSSLSNQAGVLGDSIGNVGVDASGGFFDNFLSSEGQQGWGGLALQGAGALANSWLGFQNLGVAQDQLAQNKSQFEQNFAQQKETQDRYYADRQAARDAAFA